MHQAQCQADQRDKKKQRFDDEATDDLARVLHGKIPEHSNGSYMNMTGELISGTNAAKAIPGDLNVSNCTINITVYKG